MPENLSPNLFLLDDRSPAWHLNAFLESCGTLQQTLKWSETLFGENGAEREQLMASLIEAYEHPEKADGNLPPFHALLLVFLKQLDVSKDLLNRMPAQHRALYYQAFLGLHPFGASPDRVILSLTNDQDVPLLRVSRGTQFDGGQDDKGQPVRYALEDDLWSNQGQLTDFIELRQESGSSLKTITWLSEEGKVPFPPEGARLLMKPATALSSTGSGTATLREAPSAVVISASVLATGGGERKIELILQNVVSDNTRVELWHDQRWKDLHAKYQDKNLTFSLPAEMGAITAPAGASPKEGVPLSEWPLLKISAGEKGPIPVITAISVTVTDNPAVLYGNDDGPLMLNKTSQPFGAEPRKGSMFYLASADWHSGVTYTLTLIPRWQGLPAINFQNWYKDYSKIVNKNDTQFSNTPVNPGNATVALSGSNDKPPLFNTSPTPEGSALKFTFTCLSDLQVRSTDPRDWPGHISLTQDADWGVDAFRFWQQNPPTIDSITYDQGTKQFQSTTSYTGQPRILYPPCIPEWRRVSVAYSFQGNPQRTWSIASTGEAVECDPSTEKSLLLGFTGLQPGETLSLYWRIKSMRALTGVWSYLSNQNVWKLLDDFLLDDRTEKLSLSGIWRCRVPDDATEKALILPGGRRWLKFVPDKSTPEDMSLLVQGIYTNAAIAWLTDSETVDPSHFSTPLPAGTVQRPLEQMPGLARVLQPYSSEEGKGEETLDAFYDRTARHLRHRNRAISSQDIIELLLARYDCLDSLHVISQGRNGQILLAIPRHNVSDNNNPLQPSLDAQRFKDMVGYIRGISGFSLNLKIVNPEYTYQTLYYDVDYKAGVPVNYGDAQLIKGCAEMFLPWSRSDGDAVVTPGQSVKLYDVLAWMERQDYVERVKFLRYQDVNSASVSALTVPLIKLVKKE